MGRLKLTLLSPTSFRRFLRAALWKSLRSSSCFTAAAAALNTKDEIHIVNQIAESIRIIIKNLIRVARRESGRVHTKIQILKKKPEGKKIAGNK